MLQEMLDYASRAKGRMLAQYREKAKFSAFVGELADRAQELEVVLFDVLEQTAVGTAIGVWLDRLGLVVGEERGGEGDTLYRRYVQARVRANRSEGTLEDIIAVITAWYGAAFPTLVLTEPGRANLLINLDSPDVTSAAVARLVRLLRDTRSAAVGAQLLWQEDASSKIFTFSSGATLEADSDAGFGDSSTPATGGAFRGVVQV